MNDAELIEAIRKIVRARRRRGDKSAEERDLARYDQIVGLIERHKPDAQPIGAGRQ